MANQHARQLTGLAYFMLLDIGVIFSLAGVATRSIAAYFTVDTYVIGYVFTLFTAGYSLAIFGNGFLLERINPGRETALTAILTVLVVFGATARATLPIFALSVFAYGLGLGVLCSVAYYLVVNLYDDAARPTKLNVLNFFYSAGAIAAPIIAGLALERGARWQWLYQATLPLLLAVAVWALMVKFDVKPRSVPAVNETGDRWEAGVYVLGVALLAYVLSEMIFGYWVVVYMMERMALDVALASLSLSVFWSTMAVGRLGAGRLIACLGIRRYILISAGLSFTAFAGLLLLREAYAALAAVAVMGLGYSGLYATVLAYGTQQVPRPTSELTTFFLTIGATGGILAFLLSSWLKQFFGVAVTLGVAAVLIAMVGLLTATVRPRAKQ